ncbi:hypothetical protein [Nodularia sphaerocarpa]|nr:hypothetical protein [Nodularia sphaerocarpa]MDB9374154.1 hypothetical protein [Nodularia sphaerocarpa CS-585]MDB9379326.1 hypothetical protein [Nodularia sphaerocarpa CS-585A2]
MILISVAIASLNAGEIEAIFLPAIAIFTAVAILTFKLYLLL